MFSWRDHILKEFAPQVSRLTLVADPDGLLLEEGILQGIRERGFELIPFDDHIAFRYAYETRFRSRWDKGEYTDLVVVLRSSLSDISTLPYDLLQASRRLSFNIGELFPALSYPVVASLDKSDLDALYQAQSEHNPGNLGDNMTKDFILRHVFGLAPEMIKTPADLLRVLLGRHYKGIRIPPEIDDRFVKILRDNHTFDDWLLEQIVGDKQAFLGFLQERWLPFLGSLAEEHGSGVAANRAEYGLKYNGPSLLPFNHDDVRVYVDNMFAEGMLKPVSVDKKPAEKNKWMLVGIQDEGDQNIRRRAEALLITVKNSIPGENARYHDWLQFAAKWGEFKSIQYRNTGNASSKINTLDLNKAVQGNFYNWITHRYAGLCNQPPVPPVMVHQIPRDLARRKQDNRCKVALVVMDGLALDQWYTMRSILEEQMPDMVFREDNVFAWVPTITTVSRQALFSGKPPLYFPDSIGTTDKEESHWKTFWADNGTPSHKVTFLKGVDEKLFDSVASKIADPSQGIIGIVVDIIDRIMHGMQLGAEGMHNQIIQWMNLGFLSRLTKELLDRGFYIVLTSDHGNTFVNGIGKPKEGAIADVRGERVRIYSDPSLRSKVKERFPDAIEWPSIGLPDNFFPLLAPEGSAFVDEKQSIVTHGGISVEELIVPYIRIERRQ